VGYAAGQNVTAGDGNIYINAEAATFDAPGDEGGTTRIGDSVNSNVACFIQGIGTTFQPVGGTVFEVTVDTATGQLGWDFGPNNKGNAPVPRVRAPRSLPVPRGAPQRNAMNDKVEQLQATVAQQQKQIETLTAQLREQAEEIQKVSAQLEMVRHAPRVVNNQ
jgi:uncharacterized coiled-coil protein SlyX